MIAILVVQCIRRNTSLVTAWELVALNQVPFSSWLAQLLGPRSSHLGRTFGALAAGWSWLICCFVQVGVIFFLKFAKVEKCWEFSNGKFKEFIMLRMRKTMENPTYRKFCRNLFGKSVWVGRGHWMRKAQSLRLRVVKHSTRGMFLKAKGDQRCLLPVSRLWP